MFVHVSHHLSYKIVERPERWREETTKTAEHTALDTAEVLERIDRLVQVEVCMMRLPLVLERPLSA